MYNEWKMYRMYKLGNTNLFLMELNPYLKFWFEFESMTILKFRIGLRFNEVDGVIKRTSSVTGTISVHDEWGPLL